MSGRTRRTAGGLAVLGGIVLLRPGTRANHALRGLVDRAGRRLRYEGGRLRA